MARRTRSAELDAALQLDSEHAQATQFRLDRIFCCPDWTGFSAVRTGQGFLLSGLDRVFCCPDWTGFSAVRTGQGFLLSGLDRVFCCPDWTGFSAVRTGQGFLLSGLDRTFKEALSNLHPSPTDSCPLWLNNATVAALPSKASRHNTPSRAHALSKIVRSSMAGCREECIVLVCEKSEVFASACAVSRVFPSFSRKSGSSQRRKIVVEFLLVDGGKDNTISEDDAKCLQAACNAVRLTAQIVDTPCNEMNTDDFLNEIQTVGSQVGITPVIIRGEELKQRGFGGIYGVGKAADHPPALAILSHRPTGATQTVAWVGKGIVYDTGGLSIKGKTAMPGMKRDCGGAAAVLGAFCAAVQQGFQDNLHAIFCLAENAVGPLATRPDDIHKLYSGRTVEINNTDAEGRLVLGDGVAYAAKDLQADIIVDMATLTGAQGISVGKYHAAILTNNKETKQRFVNTTTRYRTGKWQSKCRSFHQLPVVETSSISSSAVSQPLLGSSA
uniref:Cytosol aminopeptidase domain-containing protein n=1 Tax=Branchiostoma floridae TaxID=7739 RepID=C4A037_BRAFL|eukprot:XP_002585836.1 hypothetical protein BRAFLDRAFT_132933 [Branchiostoma floridae]